MTIPGTDPATSPPAAESDAYQLEETQAGPQSTSFTPAKGSDDFEQPRQKRRSKKRTPRRPGTRIGEPADSRSSSTGIAVLLGLGCAVAVLVVVAFVAPSARINVGRLIALAGLVVFLYGYVSGAYIAFTEDDLYGWLYLIFPPYAAYYFVSRWDEMKSRLVMLVVGLALLTGGGRLLETERAPAAEEVDVKVGGDNIHCSNQLVDRLAFVEQGHRPAVSVWDGGRGVDAEVVIKRREDVLE
jgi:hypothetical protein